MKRTQNRKFDLIKFLIGISNGDFFRFSLGTMEGSTEGIRPSFSGAPYAGAGGGRGGVHRGFSCDGKLFFKQEQRKEL